jgi:hypothetical protein
MAGEAAGLKAGKATQPGVAGLSHWLIVSITERRLRHAFRSSRGCHLRRKSRGSDLDTALVSLSATHQQTSCSIKLPTALSVEHDKTPNEHLISSPPGHHCVGRLSKIASPNYRQNHRIDCPSNHYLHLLVIRILRRLRVTSFSSDESSIAK